MRVLEGQDAWRNWAIYIIVAAILGEELRHFPGSLCERPALPLLEYAQVVDLPCFLAHAFLAQVRGAHRHRGAPPFDALAVELVEGAQGALQSQLHALHEKVCQSLGSHLCIAKLQRMCEMQNNRQPRLVHKEANPCHRAVLASLDGCHLLSKSYAPTVESGERFKIWSRLQEVSKEGVGEPRLCCNETELLAQKVHCAGGGN